MTKAQAKRQVCAAVASYMDPSAGHANEFLYEDQDGELCDEDVVRMKEALRDLVEELYRRGGRKVRS